MKLRKKWNQFYAALGFWLLHLYKKTFSILFWGSCRFTPTCSEYTYQAIQKHGTMRGLYLGFKRILKCHPFSAGGFDPI